MAILGVRMNGVYALVLCCLLQVGISAAEDDFALFDREQPTGVP